MSTRYYEIENLDIRESQYEDYDLVVEDARGDGDCFFNALMDNNVQFTFDNTYYDFYNHKDVRAIHDIRKRLQNLARREYNNDIHAYNAFADDDGEKIRDFNDISAQFKGHGHPYYMNAILMALFVKNSDMSIIILNSDFHSNTLQFLCNVEEHKETVTLVVKIGAHYQSCYIIGANRMMRFDELLNAHIHTPMGKFANAYKITCKKQESLTRSLYINITSDGDLNFTDIHSGDLEVQYVENNPNCFFNSLINNGVTTFNLNGNQINMEEYNLDSVRMYLSYAAQLEYNNIVNYNSNTNNKIQDFSDIYRKEHWIDSTLVNIFAKYSDLLIIILQHIGDDISIFNCPNANNKKNVTILYKNGGHYCNVFFKDMPKVLTYDTFMYSPVLEKFRLAYKVVCAKINIIIDLSVYYNNLDNIRNFILKAKANNVHIVMNNDKNYENLYKAFKNNIPNVKIFIHRSDTNVSILCKHIYNVLRNDICFIVTDKKVDFSAYDNSIPLSGEMITYVRQDLRTINYQAQFINHRTYYVYIDSTNELCCYNNGRIKCVNLSHVITDIQHVMPSLL